MLCHTVVVHCVALQVEFGRICKRVSSCSIEDNEACVFHCFRHDCIPTTRSPLFLRSTKYGLCSAEPVMISTALCGAGFVVVVVVVDYQDRWLA